MEEPILNAHNKSEWEPAHTAEHLLNATMVKLFGRVHAKGGRHQSLNQCLLSFCFLNP